MEDYLTFRKMITPLIIQVIFVVDIAQYVNIGLSYAFMKGVETEVINSVGKKLDEFLEAEFKSIQYDLRPVCLLWEDHRMEHLTQSLVSRLEQKGIDPVIMPAFIRNVGRTMALDSMMTIPELNRRIYRLGWRDIELDYSTLQLLIANFKESSQGSFAG